ncbi:hypothetical protein XELAEV_18002710mg [Xenopus laevis]|uniref:Uncharacterized protein n=1 Tax=Xenopus laevis TaxID=8355 RepID=A0A974BP33_XENLA|nr:hypothetical protein XELAEV_18002710mg [Xenopus laevis]
MMESKDWRGYIQWVEYLVSDEHLVAPPYWNVYLPTSISVNAPLPPHSPVHCCTWFCSLNVPPPNPLSAPFIASDCRHLVPLFCHRSPPPVCCRLKLVPL